MKKALIVLLLLLLVISPLLSINVRREGRGGATLLKESAHFAFSSNPALLETSNFSLNIPITARVHSFSDLLGSDLVKNISELRSMDRTRMINAGLSLLRNFYGVSPLLTLDEALSFSVRGFGLSVDATERAIISNGSVASALSLELDVRVQSGLSFTLDFAPEYALSIGVMPRATYRMKTSDVSVETVVDMYLSSNIEETIIFYESLDLSLDIGTLMRFPYGFKTALVLKDISPSYTLRGQNGSELKYDSPFSVDAAIGWKGEFSFLTLDLELGMKGINKIKEAEDLMKSINAGLSLGLTRFIEINAGLSGGYPSVGLSFNLYVISIDLAYFYEDYGIIYGINPRDVIALEIAIRFP